MSQPYPLDEKVIEDIIDLGGDVIGSPIQFLEGEAVDSIKTIAQASETLVFDVVKDAEYNVMDLLSVIKNLVLKFGAGLKKNQHVIILIVILAAYWYKMKYPQYKLPFM
jgi:hypothetical protein